MQSFTRRVVLAACAVCLVSGLAGSAMAAADIVGSAEIISWSKSEKVFCVKLMDANRGPSFSIRKLKTGAEVANYPFDLANEKAAYRRAKKKHALRRDLHQSQTSPDEAVTIMGKDAKGGYEIVATYDGMMGVVQTLGLTPDKQSGATPTASLKSVSWTPDGKFLIYVINQKLEGQLGRDVDVVYSRKFRVWKVDWQ